MVSAWQELQEEIDSFGGQKDARLKAATAKLKAAKAALEKVRGAAKAAEAAHVAASAEGDAASDERVGLLQQLEATKLSVVGARYCSLTSQAPCSMSSLHSEQAGRGACAFGKANRRRHADS